MALTITGAPGGATITDDTTTNATRYLLFDDVTSGASTSIGTSSTKLTYNPSSGEVAATNFNSTSDISLKTNLERINNSFSLIDKLNGYSFDWKDRDGSSYGVVAQEVEKVLPYAVQSVENKKTVNYSAIIPVLLEALKELNLRVKQLESK